MVYRCTSVMPPLGIFTKKGINLGCILMNTSGNTFYRRCAYIFSKTFTRAQFADLSGVTLSGFPARDVLLRRSAPARADLLHNSKSLLAISCGIFCTGFALLILDRTQVLALYFGIRMDISLCVCSSFYSSSFKFYFSSQVAVLLARFGKGRRNPALCVQRTAHLLQKKLVGGLHLCLFLSLWRSSGSMSAEKYITSGRYA